MPICKNKGCTGHARRGQYFCYDCYTAWHQGGDDAVAKRIEEMQKGDRELADLRLTVERVREFVLGPKEFMGTPVGRDYSDLALWDRLGRDKQLLIKLRRAHRDATGANPKGLSLAERNDRLWAWLEDQLDRANKPKSTVLETLRFEIHDRPRAAACSDCVHLVGGCPRKHPSAKTTDEAEPLRLRVAELEGKLLCAQQSVIPALVVKGLCVVSMLAGMGFGFLLP